MNRITTKNFRLLLKKHKGIIICVSIISVIIVWLLTRPETVAYGNGYSHQVGSFGECDINSDDCLINATHRRHHLFGNEDYCESCWEIYGKGMFERLSNKSDSSKLDYDKYKCRHTGCDKKAKTSDWEHRFCEEHIQGMKYCRYPNCGEQIPISGTSKYCWQHR